MVTAWPGPESINRHTRVIELCRTKLVDPDTVRPYKIAEVYASGRDSGASGGNGSGQVNNRA